MGGICLTAARTLAHSQNRRIKFQEGSQLFVGVHNEALTVAAMCVSHEDRLPFAIYGCDAAPTPAIRSVFRDARPP
jgi:hypothetical protein